MRSCYRCREMLLMAVDCGLDDFLAQQELHTALMFLWRGRLLDGIITGHENIPADVPGAGAILQIPFWARAFHVALYAVAIPFSLVSMIVFALVPWLGKITGYSSHWRRSGACDYSARLKVKWSSLLLVHVPVRFAESHCTPTTCASAQCLQRSGATANGRRTACVLPLCQMFRFYTSSFLNLAMATILTVMHEPPLLHQELWSSPEAPSPTTSHTAGADDDALWGLQSAAAVMAQQVQLALARAWFILVHGSSGQDGGTSVGDRLQQAAWHPEDHQLEILLVMIPWVATSFFLELHDAWSASQASSDPAASARRLPASRLLIIHPVSPAPPLASQTT